MARSTPKTTLTVRRHSSPMRRSMPICKRQPRLKWTFPYLRSPLVPQIPSPPTPPPPPPPSHLPDPKTYLSLGRTHPRLSTISLSPCTRRAFARSYFTTHPLPILSYLARYIRLHTILGDGLAHCTTLHPLIDEREAISYVRPSKCRPPHHAAGGEPQRMCLLLRERPEGAESISWRFHAFAEVGAAVDLEEGVVLARLLERIDGAMRSEVVPSGGWDMENVGRVLEMEDVVFAERMVGVVEKRRRRTEKMGLVGLAEKQLFGRMGLMRDVYGCGCRVGEIEGCGWRYGERDREAWREYLMSRLGVHPDTTFSGDCHHLGVDSVFGFAWKGSY
ncbi:hypothetical protein BJ508DRAFT_334548 [Ascobolus immersus RN42]|uniref:Uncharacterized protein n=1 Tax=Ascobolus immersus RN42 TaxID=1160509 RepID=A0A3N4HM79_ASCIM|nr:hypothetical protein BJ508DRAFT_334548 [Ascobolus immersus RN42]